MAKTVNRYFQFFSSNRDIKPSGRLWYPAADMYKAPDGWLVKVELAGVSPEDVEVEAEGNSLYITGTRRDKVCDAGVSYHQMEITYSRFEKTLLFPETIDGAKLERKFDNGLLIIRIHNAIRGKQ